MIYSERLAQFAATFLRAGTLATRFVLMFYLASRLSLSDMGVFSLYWAGVSLAASLIPLDVYAHTARILLSKGMDRYEVLSRHFGFLVLAIGLFLPLAVWLNVIWGAELEGRLLVLFMALLPLEVLATDIGRLLVPLGKPLLSNLVLFTRSALWVFPLIALSYFEFIQPSLEEIVLIWFFGACLSVFMGFSFLQLAIYRPLKIYVDFCWIKKVLLSSAIFLIATLIFRILLGVDRYIVGEFFDESVVAIYAVYASISLGVLGLIESGISSWHYPSLVRAVREGRREESLQILFRFVRHNTMASLSLMALIAISFPLAADIFLSKEYIDNLNVFYVISFGVLIYCISMPFHYYIYASEKDWRLVAIYTLSLVCMTLWAYFLMPGFGILGAGIMLSLSLVAVAILRLFFAAYEVFSYDT